MDLSELDTPALVLDEPRMMRNIERMRTRLQALEVGFRPHLKTCKSIEVARRLVQTPSGPATVSTLKEAEQFFAHGIVDLLYAVGLSPGKFEQVEALRRRGCELTVVLDSVEVAAALSAFCAERRLAVPVLIEIDSDGHRSGIEPDNAQLLEVAQALRTGAELRGVMTHAGASYACRSVAALVDMAERERRGAVRAAERLRGAGRAAPVVSVGSTPTATFAEHLDGVTEVRAGVFVFFDLVMAGLGVCAIDDVAASVLTTVIGHQKPRGWLITDAGWMAMSRDRGTAAQPLDWGYGAVCDVHGRLLEELRMSDANQEHGIVSRRDAGPIDWDRFPIGSRLRILPNHACATAAQHAAYRVLDASGRVAATWERFGGW